MFSLTQIAAMMVTDAEGFRTVPPRRSGQQLGDYIPSSRPETRNKNRFQPLSVADGQAVAQRVETPKHSSASPTSPPSLSEVSAAFSFNLCGYTAFTDSISPTDFAFEWPGGGDSRLCPLSRSVCFSFCKSC